MSTNYPFNDRQYIGYTSFNGQGAYYCEQKVRERLNEKSELSQCGTFYRWGRDDNRRCDGWDHRVRCQGAPSVRGVVAFSCDPILYTDEITMQFLNTYVYMRKCICASRSYCGISFKKRNGENLRPQAANLVASHLNTPLKSSCKLFDYETL